MRFRPHILVLIALAFAVSGLAGCGQKGPLVPPKAIAPISVAPFTR